MTPDLVGPLLHPDGRGRDTEIPIHKGAVRPKSMEGVLETVSKLYIEVIVSKFYKRL